MVTPHNKRSMVFIDARNLMGGWWSYCKEHGYVQYPGPLSNPNLLKKISYIKLLKEICCGTDLIRGYYFDAVSEPVSNEKQRFFDMLRANEITVVTKPLRYKSVECKHCGKVDAKVPYQKGVDVSLVTEIMGLSFEKAYDIAIVVSGDSDFVDAINYVKKKGLKVWVASFTRVLGDDTMRAADKVVRLDRAFVRITL